MKIFFLSVLLLAFSQVSAQNPISALEMYLQILDESVTDENNLTVDSTTPLEGLMILDITDLAQVAKIHVKVGSADGSGDLFSGTFLIDPTVTDHPLWYNEGNILYLQAGSYTGVNNFFAEAAAEDFNGIITAPVKFFK